MDVTTDRLGPRTRSDQYRLPYGQVDAWIDFNRDNSWDPSEKILDSVVVSNATQTLNFNLPPGLAGGAAFARVRLSSDGNLNPTGPAVDGEVEDYLVIIGGPPIVQSVIINHGDPQRSGISSATVTFSGVAEIDLATGDVFHFINTDTSDVVVDIPVVSQANGRTVVNFTFARDQASTRAEGCWMVTTC